MRKNINSFHIEGYIYDSSKISKKVSGEKSQHPGTEFYSGELAIATDEQGLNVIPVHFTYVTEFYSKSGKVNNTFTALKRILEAEDNTWVAGGKENAMKVKIDGSLSLNDFIADDGKRVSGRRCEGSFVTIVDTLCDISERNTFQVDMVINRVNHVDADPERNIEKDYTTVGGAVFNFRNEILPVELRVHNPGGMKYFENLEVSNAEPMYTKVWGRIVSETIKVVFEEESAWGDAVVRTSEQKNREWVITGTAKVPYDFEDESVMTSEELKKAVQNREVHWAEVKAQKDAYVASKEATPKTTATPNTDVPSGVFSF